MNAPEHKRARFPLSLSQTASLPKRLVRAPYALKADIPAAGNSAGNSVGNSADAPASVREAVVLVVQKARTDPVRALGAPPPAVAQGPHDGHGHAAARGRLVERLRADGCRDEAVLQAFASVPRHLFVDAGLSMQAYEDTSLPIGLGQTISKPSVVARMIELMRARPGGSPLGRVLEIGTGCGYQAALLALLARNVYSIERLRPLFDRARENLLPIRPDNLRLVYGDGRLGHGPNAPYDGIIAAAGGQDIPLAWLDQLAPMGRLVAPVHDSVRGAQVLVVIDRLADGQIRRTAHETVRFVPLESGVDMRGH